jgi:hypothetical protein
LENQGSCPKLHTLKNPAHSSLAYFRMGCRGLIGSGEQESANATGNKVDERYGDFATTEGYVAATSHLAQT